LKIDGVKVNGKDDNPYIMEKNPNVWNHQSDKLRGIYRNNSSLRSNW
jgi:hypothetical protein